MMLIRQTLSLAAAVGVLALSLVTLARTPTVVQVMDCASEGAGYGETCQATFGPGGEGSYCAICVGYFCGGMAQGNEECFGDCFQAGLDYCMSP